MDSNRDDNNQRNNMMYYNQQLRHDKKKQVKKKSPSSFGSQIIDFRKYTFVPEGYEGIMYVIYLIAIPYIFGAVFLFFYISHGVASNFMLLDTSAFLIVWAIGYEIVAAIVLLYLLFSFLTYDTKSR